VLEDELRRVRSALPGVATERGPGGRLRRGPQHPSIAGSPVSASWTTPVDAPDGSVAARTASSPAAAGAGARLAPRFARAGGTHGSPHGPGRTVSQSDTTWHTPATRNRRRRASWSWHGVCLASFCADDVPLEGWSHEPIQTQRFARDMLAGGRVVRGRVQRRGRLCGRSSSRRRRRPGPGRVR
jgi:hypothetical protein